MGRFILPRSLILVPILACSCPCRFFVSSRLSSRPASRPCVSCLLVVLRGRAFSFRRSPVVPVFAFVPFHRFRRLVLRLVCACRETGRCVDGACDGTRGVVVGRVMIWMGRGRSPFSSCLLVLRCPPGYDRRDRPALPVCLLAVLSFRYGDGYEARHGWETVVRMTRHARLDIIAAPAERGNAARWNETSHLATAPPTA